ncbi:MAG: VWA domain-containing protein [Oscillospiraceae bacterium]|nr:VWA domain-containing protein [Oscillospiraceae bacterium]
MRIKKILSFAAALMLILSFCICGGISASAERNKTSNRFNVVFVLDSSGSMNQTDPDGWRFTAVSLFTGLLAERGNYAGGVVFSDGILVKQPLSEIRSAQDKKQLLDRFESAEVLGWTNTGAALMTAEELLAQGGGEGLPNIIIYLTDGNTEMGTPEDTALSLDQKAQAIQDARDKGIQIYSVCLNANSINSGSTNPQEMEQIAAATGGGFEEVRSSEDLAAVFQRFYELIYSTVSSEIAGGKFDRDGVFRSEFSVPSAGVEELNIITTAQGGITGMELTTPSGKLLSQKDVDQLSMRAGDYCITKITAPEGGKWTLCAYGQPDAEIQISMIFNKSLSVSAELKNPAEEYRIGDTVQLRTVIETNGEIASDMRVLDEYQIDVTVTNEKDQITPLEIRAENGEFLSDFNVTDYGTFTFRVAVAGFGITAGSTPVTVYVGNTPPTPPAERIEAVGNIWPLSDLDCAVDLTGAATDKEDADLQYSVVSSSFLDDSYELDGNILRMKDFDISKGSFTVRATDSMGASCDFEVYMSSRNMGARFALILGILIAVIVIVSAVRFYQIMLRYFHGKFHAVAYSDEQGDIEEKDAKPIRGRCRLAAFGFNANTGLPYAKIFFQATGKNTHTYLYSRKPVYVMGSNMPSNVPAKKFRVNRNSEITLSTDKNYSQGLRITFEPDE